MTLKWTKFILDDPSTIPLYQPMKDQNAIHEEETKDQKYNRALDLYIESVHKPDNALRSCAHNQKCYNELMEVREEVLRYVHTLRRSNMKKLEIQENQPKPKINLDGSKSYEYAAHVTLIDIAKFQRGSSL